MRAGRLRHKVDIQQPIEVQNAYGEAEVTWQDVVSGVWAGIEPLRGREFWAAKQFNSEIEARVIMRYRSDVTTKMRIKHGDNEYYIASMINPNERNQELQLMCTRSIE